MRQTFIHFFHYIPGYPIPFFEFIVVLMHMFKHAEHTNTNRNKQHNTQKIERTKDEYPETYILYFSIFPSFSLIENVCIYLSECEQKQEKAHRHIPRYEHHLQYHGQDPATFVETSLITPEIRFIRVFHNEIHDFSFWR